MRKHKKEIIQDLRIAISAKEGQPRFIFQLLRSLRDRGIMHKWIKDAQLYDLPKRMMWVDEAQEVDLEKIAKVLVDVPTA